MILAVGQAADLSLLGDDLHVERTPQGGFASMPTRCRRRHPRIWAGGDVARGPRNLIDAIADGQRAAASIRRSLGQRAPPGLRTRSVSSCVTGFRRLDTGYDAIPRQEVPVTPTDRRIGFAEVEVGYDATLRGVEALRCLRCFDNVMLSPELCILCGLCVDVCPPDCITIVRADRVGAEPPTQSVLLLDEDLCIRCGLCVNRCPPGALSMVYAKEVVHG